MIQRLILSAMISFSVFSLMTYLMGRSGVVAMDELIQYRDQLDANIDDLQKRNGYLSKRLELLRYDQETLELKARLLDYYEKEHKVIRIHGWRINDTQYYEPGRVYQYRKQYRVPVSFLRVASVLSGLAAFLLLLLIPARKRLLI